MSHTIPQRHITTSAFWTNQSPAGSIPAPGLWLSTLFMGFGCGVSVIFSIHGYPPGATDQIIVAQVCKGGGDARFPREDCEGYLGAHGCGQMVQINSLRPEICSQPD